MCHVTLVIVRFSFLVYVFELESLGRFGVRVEQEHGQERRLRRKLLAVTNHQDLRKIIILRQRIRHDL